MSAFTQFTSIQPMPKANKRITTQPLVYYVGEEGSDEVITVPTGFEFDGASVPKIFGMFIQKVEPQTINAVAIHDRLYTDGRRYSRRKTERTLLEALLCTAPVRKSVIMYMGVLLGGWYYWYKIDKKFRSLFE